MNSITQHIEKLTKSIFKKKGFFKSKIITEWHLIVGERLANATLPRKLVFKKLKDTEEGTLFIWVKNNSFGTELLYLEQLIIEKITIYFGFKCVNKIKIAVNNNIFPAITYKNFKEFSLPEEKAKWLKQQLTNLEDDELKTAIENLGKKVLIHNLKDE